MFSLFWEKLSSSFDFDRLESLGTLQSKSMILWVLSGGLKSGNILAEEPTTFRLLRRPFPLLCEGCLSFFSGFANGGRTKTSCSLLPATVMSLHEYTLRLNLLCLFSPGLPNSPPTSTNSSLSSLPSTIVLRCRVIFNLGRNGTFCFML